jgi:predicted DNA-binding transcriptional regulator AlpA
MKNTKHQRQCGEDIFLTLEAAAEMTCLARATWYNGGAGTDRVPRIRLGRSIRVRRSDVEQWIAARIAEAVNAVRQ